MDAEEALAESWASIDGKMEAFRDGKGLPTRQQPGGHYSGYMAEAQEMIARLRKRGFTLIRTIQALDPDA